MSPPHKSSSTWLSPKILMPTVVVVGVVVGGYYCYHRCRKIHFSDINKTSTCSSRCASSFCAALANCVNAASERMSSLFIAGQKEEGQSSSRDEVSFSPCNLSLAKEKKTAGNKFFSEGKMIEAIDCYSAAISNLPKDHHELSICYCNRAACHLSQGQHQKVIEDCTMAIKLSPLYLKAYERRSRAHESLGHTEAVLSDLTACCVIDGFSNQSFPQRLEKALRSSSQSIATKLVQVLHFGGDNILEQTMRLSLQIFHG